MRELSLFTGAGGGVLGTKILGWRAVGYVEWEPFCQRVLVQRIADGHLDPAPVFGDVRAFVRGGYAAAYSGLVDVVTAGFPCQPFSIAGQQLGPGDHRNMWPATIDVIRAVQPAWVLLGNVPGILCTGYCETIFAELAESGFDARWGVFSAADEGAPHIRERLWIVANARGAGSSQRPGLRGVEPEASGASTGALAARGNRWPGAPGVCRVGHGLADRMDRVKALGNGQVPAVVARAWRELSA